MALEIPLGIDDFRQLRELGLTYVDKTHLVRELLDMPGAQVVLLPRPRRFGKSLNLSMLRCFFERREEDFTELFEGLAIASAGDEYRSCFQRYPVIHLTFKGATHDTYEACWGSLAKKIEVLFREHGHVLTSGRLTEEEAGVEILVGRADRAVGGGGPRPRGPRPRYDRAVTLRALTRHGLLGLALVGTPACGKRATKDASTTPGLAGTAEASAGAFKPSEAEPASDESKAAEPEEVDVEWEDSPFQADLDGDGTPESITWSCGGTLVLTVGRAEVREEYQIVEEMSCGAAAVALVPRGATRQLVISIDEHEEVGPDLVMLYAYLDGSLELLWSDKAAVRFLSDGSWTTETSDCYESHGYRATWYGQHRWDGQAVTSKEQEVRDPMEPGDCAEP